MGTDDLVASAAYQPEPTAAAAARRFVRDTLQAWVVTGDGDDGQGVVDDAVLLTSELVTNAVVHAGTAVQVTCKLADGEVEVVVSDCHPARLVPELAGSGQGVTDSAGGRGLLLPAALASAWGVTYGRSAKAVWFRLGLPGRAAWENGVAGGLEAGRREPGAQVAGGGNALAAAFGSALVTAPDAAGPVPRNGTADDGGADSGYRGLLAAAAESARATVNADGSFVLMPDEDGDLRLQATAGTMPPAMDMAAATDAATDAASDAARGEHGPGGQRHGRPGAHAPPSVLTVPFIVDGRVTGLVSVASARPGRFGDTEAKTLQRFADICGPRLQRAWLDQLQRVRRGRIAGLAHARGLLAGRLAAGEVMGLAGGAVVPALAPWCAVLLPGGRAGLRPAYVCHHDDGRADALARLLAQACESAPPGPPAERRPDSGPGWRWRLPGEAAGAALREAAGGDAAWCFPVGQPGADQGLLVIGSERGGRLSREVAALAGDVASRIGFALAGTDGLTPARHS